MPEPQSLKNHARFDPPFHFVLGPILIVNFILSIYITIRDWPMHSRSHLWWIVMSVAVFVLAGKARGYALVVQDRVIRLEERLRYAAMLTSPEVDLAGRLTIKQIVALRFASDAELPALLQRAVTEKLTPKQIKQSIQVWRPDYERV